MLTSTPIPTLYQCGHIQHRAIELKHLDNLPCIMEARNYLGPHRDCPACYAASKERRCS